MLVIPSAISPIITCIEALHPESDEVILLLFSEHNTPDIPELTQCLNSRNITFFGGIFPGLIYGNQRVTEGCIIKKFKSLMPPFCVSGIAAAQTSDFPYYHATEHIEKGTAIVLLDGLTPNIYRFLEKLNDLLGESCHFIGAGAGSITLHQRPCVFCNTAFLEDAAVVCVVENTIHLGVRHGWEQLDGPLVATQTEGNTILELNWRSALEVYNEIVEKDGGVALTPDNFAGIAQVYPIGILREKEDDIVRDPLKIGENGAIVCIGEVPTNAVVHVLKGHPGSLLHATRMAVQDCTPGSGPPIHAEMTFVIDCITRVLFLGEQFDTELNIVREALTVATDEQEPFGVLSLGEISSYGDGLLELFNKTIVIGTFY